MLRGLRRLAPLIVIALLTLAGPSTAAAVGRAPGADSDAGASPVGEVAGDAAPWVWPADAFRLTAAYRRPAHRYGEGHRGIDLRPAGQSVRAPAAGTIAFVGTVAGRGIVTIDHGGGLVTTLEPVDALVAAGTVVARGDTVATLALGGHSAAGELHFGVRRDGEYINPLLLLGGVPRAVLLPCC